MRGLAGTALLDAGFLHTLAGLGESGGRALDGRPELIEFLRKGVVLVLAGSGIDLEARAVRAQARDDALDLEEMELLLAELLLEPGHVAFENGELAVAILEDGVRAAEQRKLRLLVL